MYSNNRKCINEYYLIMYVIFTRIQGYFTNLQNYLLLNESILRIYVIFYLLIWYYRQLLIRNLHVIFYKPNQAADSIVFHNHTII